MKKFLMSLAVLTAALVSCQKNEIPVSEEVQGIPMTLTASLPGDFGTKTTVSPDGNVLKSYWEATETISVVTLDATGDAAAMVSVDTFTSTGAAGRTDAVFTGTFTGGASPAKVIVVYPALEKQADDTYQTPPFSGTHSVLAGAKPPLSTQFTGCDPFATYTQTSDGNCDHFKNYCIMTGNVDLTDILSNTLTVKLRNLMSVFKIVATYPAGYEGKSLNYIAVASHASDDTYKNIFHRGDWTYLNIEEKGLAFPYGGDYGRPIYCDFNVPSSGVVTVYMPFPMDGSSNVAGDYFTFTSVANGTTLAGKKTFTKDVTYEAGKVYRMEVTLND